MRLDVAQHEAAHVVVGVSLGLRLRHATARPCAAEGALGYAWFATAGHRASHALMYAAGVAWDRRVGCSSWLEQPDAVLCREHLPGRGGLEMCVRAADAMLRGLGPVHQRVTRALMARNITHADVLALARGERIRVID